ncbi:hypothetical protein IQ268_03410 [Oculatella sp. LEGE 06141]|nr:hypothetical protein [Oculatella sp. LEGE 06141]MBE9177625.1 hypothetical protein [Oculatella sp. LEGE 06141]
MVLSNAVPPREFIGIHPALNEYDVIFSNSLRDFPQEWRFNSPLLEG